MGEGKSVFFKDMAPKRLPVIHQMTLYSYTYTLAALMTHGVKIKEYMKLGGNSVWGRD